MAVRSCKSKSYGLIWIKIDMYTLKEYIKAWLKGFLKILTGRVHFDPSLMERVKSCYQEDGGHYKHLLKRS